MHTTVRCSDFCDRRLQMSNARRKWTADKIRAALMQSTMTTSPCKPDVLVVEEPSILQDGEYDNATRPSSSLSLQEPCHVLYEDSPWLVRSVSTPNPNYALRSSSQNGVRPSSSSFALGSGHRRVLPGERPLLIHLKRGGAGITPECTTSSSSFGFGSRGLGPRAVSVQREATQSALQDWNTKKEKAEFEDRVRLQNQRRELEARNRPKTIKEVRMQKLMEEDKRCAVARQVKDVQSALLKAARLERDEYQSRELGEITAARSLEMRRRAERQHDMDAHAAAAQHLAKLQLAARQLEEMHRMEERESLIMERQAAAASDRDRHASTLQQLNDERLRSHRDSAERLRKGHQRAEAAATKAEKEMILALNGWTKKQHNDMKQSVLNARAVLEANNSRRHDRLKRESEHLAALRREREAAAIAKNKAEALVAREQHRSVSRAQSPCSDYAEEGDEMYESPRRDVSM